MFSLFVLSIVKFSVLLWPSLFQHYPLLLNTTSPLAFQSSSPSASARNLLSFPPTNSFADPLLMLWFFPPFSHCKLYTGTDSTVTTVPPRAGWQLPLWVCSLLFPFTHFMQHLSQWASGPQARHLKHRTECKYNHIAMESCSCHSYE